MSQSLHLFSNSPSQSSSKHNNKYDNDHDHENSIINSFKSNFNTALSHKINIESPNNTTITIPTSTNNSIFIWNGNNSIIDIPHKCNQLFLHNCNKIYVKAKDFISGITILHSNNCVVTLYDTPLFSLEISHSLDNFIRSSFFYMPILFQYSSLTLIKHFDYQVDKILLLQNALFTSWQYCHHMF